MSHVVLKPTPKPKPSGMAALYETTESLVLSIQRSFTVNSKVKKYERGFFY
jgi:hypothetical protein